MLIECSYTWFEDYLCNEIKIYLFFDFLLYYSSFTLIRNLFYFCYINDIVCEVSETSKFGIIKFKFVSEIYKLN